MKNPKTASDILEDIRYEQNTISYLIEDVKTQMCDNFCKYPNRYDLNDESEYDSMIDDVCSHCPLNYL